MDIVDLLDRALTETGGLVDGVRRDQLELPTPCSEWDVRTLIGHLVRGNLNTAAAAEGTPRNQNPIADIGDAPITAYRESADAVRQAWSDRSQLDAMYQSPFGEIPGRALLTLRLADNVTHGWDLAKATGQAPHYDDVVQTALDFVTGQFGAERPLNGPFKAPVAVPENAAPIDHLAAYLGREL